MTLLYLINTSTTVRYGTDDTEAYAATSNDEKDRGLDLTLPRCMQKEQAHPSQTLNKTKKNTSRSCSPPTESSEEEEEGASDGGSKNLSWSLERRSRR